MQGGFLQGDDALRVSKLEQRAQVVLWRGITGRRCHSRRPDAAGQSVAPVSVFPTVPILIHGYNYKEKVLAYTNRGWHISLEEQIEHYVDRLLFKKTHESPRNGVQNRVWACFIQYQRAQ